MIKFLKVAVLLSSTFAASCFAASSPVVDTNAAVVLEQIKTQNAETNALLKELVKQNAGRVSEQAGVRLENGNFPTLSVLSLTSDFVPLSANP